MHAYWRNDRVFEWCKQQGIHVTAYGPLSSPGMAASMDKDHLNLLEVGLHNCYRDSHAQSRCRAQNLSQSAGVTFAYVLHADVIVCYVSVCKRCHHSS